MPLVPLPTKFRACNVVISGGGRHYVALAGAVQALLDFGIGVRGVGGVSAGAIVAASYAAWLPGNGDLWELIQSTLPGSKIKLDRRWWPFSWPHGLYTGDNLLETFRNVFQPTFGAGRIPLAVVTCPLGAPQKIWSSWHTPHADLPKAIRASMSVPGLFEPVKIGRQWHVDGGLTSNFPLDDIKWPNNSPTLGLKVVPIHTGSREPDGIGEYIAQIVDTLILNNMREDEDDAKDGKTTVLPVVVKGDSLDLNITPEQAHASWRQGYTAVYSALEGDLFARLFGESDDAAESVTPDQILSESGVNNESGDDEYDDGSDR